MSKYDALTRHLAARKSAHVPMTFEEIEALLGFPLPPSSRRHRAWWSNNPSNSVMTKAWLLAGYQSRAVDLEQGRLIFEKLNAVDPDEPRRPRRHPLFGLSRGEIRLAPDLDLTEPADPGWGRRIDAQKGAWDEGME